MNDLVYVVSAFILGALHALEPGHGKTVVAAYLVGSKGRVSDAILLGGIVTFTHTFSIIILALLTAVAAAYLVPETVQAVLEVVSGLLIVGVGLWLVYKRIVKREMAHGHAHGGEHSHAGRQRAPRRAEELPASHWQAQPALALVGSGASHWHGPIMHAHPLPAGQAHHHHGGEIRLHHAEGHTIGSISGPGHDHGVEHGQGHDHGATHDHGHRHDHGHDHSQALPTGARPGLGGLVTLGISGGIVPCPAALALLLAAVGVGNILGGVSLVVVFSLGLAAVLIALGIILVKASDLATRFLGEKGEDSPIVRYAGAASAIVVTLLGLAMTARAVVDLTGLRLF